MVEVDRFILGEVPSSVLEKHFGFSYVDDLIVSEDIRSVSTLKAEKFLKDRGLRSIQNWYLALFEEEFIQKKYPKLILQYIHPLVGYGIIAGEDLPAWTYIGQYAGVVRKRKKECGNPYIFGYDIAGESTSYVIDAKEFGNHTRFLNHSSTPTLYSRWMIMEGLCRVIFYTHGAVAKGEQLTYDYGPDYWKSRPSPIG